LILTNPNQSTNQHNQTTGPITNMDFRTDFLALDPLHTTLYGNGSTGSGRRHIILHWHHHHSFVNTSFKFNFTVGFELQEL